MESGRRLLTCTTARCRTWTPCFSPPRSGRLSFSIGVKTFDPVRVGYLTDVPGFPRFNVKNPDGTPIVGNSNAGHEFGAKLSDDERSWLVEYLKTL